MDHEFTSLTGWNAFTPEPLPPGHKAIGICWVYDFKFHPNHTIIPGKEKACLVAQGCGQLPEDYSDIYASVVKPVGICIILA